MSLNEIQIRILHSGECLACRIPSLPEIKCWLSITPFQIHPETGMATLSAPAEPWIYRVRHFGIPADFDYFNYDLHPEYITNYTNEVVTSIRQIHEAVAPIVSEFNLLVESRECACPL